MKPFVVDAGVQCNLFLAATTLKSETGVQCNMKTEECTLTSTPLKEYHQPEFSEEEGMDTSGMSFYPSQESTST